MGHSVRQDNSTVERWIDLLDRFNSWETREHIWRKMIRNVHEVLLAELPATLVEIASQVELGELESLVRRRVDKSRVAKSLTARIRCPVRVPSDPCDATP